MDLLDVLLMRVLDGEASDEDRARLLELGDAEQRLARLQELRSELQGALEHAAASFGEVDFADDIMAAIQPGLSAVEDAQTIDEPITEDLGLALRLSAMIDGELSGEERLAMGEHLAANPNDVDLMTGFADLGRELRQGVEENIKGDTVDVWSAVAGEIGIADPEEVPGWDAAADVLREAVAARAEISAEDEGRLTAAIMNALPRPEALPEPVTEEEPESASPWSRIFSSPGVLAMAALAVLLVMVGQTFVPDEAVETAPPTEVATVIEAPAEEAPSELYALVHETEVESLETDDDVLVQVMQMEEGAPLFLMIDEGDEGATL